MLKMSHVLLTTVLAMSAVLPARSKAQTSSAAGGAVFVMTNAANNNQIVAYKRNSDGSLEEGQTFPTGGRGSGGVTDPLGSQGALTLNEKHTLLFAVNAGSGNISVFQVRGANLTLLETVPCGGSEPVAVAAAWKFGLRGKCRRRERPCGFPSHPGWAPEANRGINHLSEHRNLRTRVVIL